MRIAVATASHETNTFTDARTTIDDFETAADEALLEEFDGARSLSGIVDRLRSGGAEIVPTYGAATIPSGVVTREAFDAIQSGIIDRLAEERLNGVCLDLHGSMYVDGLADPEGELLAAIRDEVGPDVPITAALDMHATITEQMVAHLDGVAGYRTAPHTDVVETGERAADLLLSAVADDVALALGWEPFPMLLAGEQSETDSEPMRTLIDELRERDRIDGVYDANYFLGFPWADSPYAGCHALVTGDAAAVETIERTARELAERFWGRRDEFDFTTEAHDLDSALDTAANHSGRPVVIADTGDIPGAGASENAVDALAAVLERDDLGRPLVAVIADADAHRTCEAAGEGASVSFELGRFAEANGGLRASGTVRAVRETDGVNAAFVSLDGVDVVITDRQTNVHRDPEYFRGFDVEPGERDVIVLKSGYLSPAWKEAASRRLFALTPGDTDQRLAELPYDRIPRPMYPVDESVDWAPNGSE
ncbi:M81 family metallopeptidase [Halosimplex sp. J119]